MPHCIAEHSKNIDGLALSQAIFDGAKKTRLFDEDGRDIKVRAIPYEAFILGNGEESFVHVQLRILEGRNEKQKFLLSKVMLSEINMLNLNSCSVTIEVVDMDAESYSKQSS